jgi:superkiller protein 3
MSVKAGLKAAKAAIDSENYDQAINEAQKVLSIDPRNYFA